MLAPIYLDHNATTPLLPEVAHAMRACWAEAGFNPASQHAFGRRAHRMLEDARDRIAELLGAKTSSPGADRVIFTSGGTEADNHAIFGAVRAHGGVPVCTAIEHHAVLHPVEALDGPSRADVVGVDEGLGRLAIGVAGVQLGLNVPYSFANPLMSGEDILKNCLQLGISAVELRTQPVEVFLGVPASRQENSVAPGHYLVRNIVGHDSAKGILAVAEEVYEGQNIVFTLRDGNRAREDLEQMLQRQKQRLAGKKPVFGLYFNCCARGSSLYGVAGIDSAYIRRALGNFPLIGMFGGYELAPLGRANHLFAYTGVLVLIAE